MPQQQDLALIVKNNAIDPYDKFVVKEPQNIPLPSTAHRAPYFRQQIRHIYTP
jgi:hypothetical protein